MKKVIMIAGAVAVCFSSVLVSCQKDNVIGGSGSANESAARITRLSDDYIAQMNQHANSKKFSDFFTDRVKRILGKDLEKAVTGGAAGFAVGTAAPGVGNGVGLIIGAVVAGAGGSLNEAGKTEALYNSTNNNQGNPNAGSIEVASFQANPENPYNHMGLNHYEMCNSFIMSIDNGEGSDEFYAYGIDQMYPLYGVSYDDASIFTNSDYLSVLSTNSDGSTADGISIAYNEGLISEDIQDILLPYIESFELSEDVNDFVAYSIQAENIILGDGSLTEKDKQIILGAMATARYGSQYWTAMVEE